MVALSTHILSLPFLKPWFCINQTFILKKKVAIQTFQVNVNLRLGYDFARKEFGIQTLSTGVRASLHAVAETTSLRLCDTHQPTNVHSGHTNLFFNISSKKESTAQRCSQRSVWGGGAETSLNMADQLTLVKPRGRICPSHYCQPPRIQKAALHCGFLSGLMIFCQKQSAEFGHFENDQITSNFSTRQTKHNDYN